MNLSGMKMDMSVLATISPPDVEAQKKYEAMGLPDPFAFAALTAMGAIPNPMEMLNSMMLAAQTKSAGAGQAPPPPMPMMPPSMPTGGFSVSKAASFAPPAPPAPDMPAPGGRSFVEAFRDLQKTQPPVIDIRPPDVLPAPAKPASGYAMFAQRGRAAEDLDNEGERLEDRLAKSAREVEAQAKMAADRAKDIAMTWSTSAYTNRDAFKATIPGSKKPDPMAVRSVADAFSVGGDDDGGDASGMAPAPFTLSSLLGSRQQAPDAQQGIPMGAVAQPTMEKICISKMPLGTTESAVRLECARHGAVKSVILEVDGSAAYVTFATPTMAETAVKRMSGRIGILGSAADPVKVRLLGELPDHVRHAVIPGPEHNAPMNADELPEYLKPRMKQPKKKKKKRSRSRKKRKRSKSRVSWLDRSRSKSHTAQGQYIRAVGYSSTVKWWEKKRSDSSSSSSSGGKRGKKEDPEARRPRQVAVKGNWAEFVQNGKSYYYNVLTGVTTWDQPGDFDSGPSRRQWEGLGVGFSTRSKDKPTGTFL